MDESPLSPNYTTVRNSVHQLFFGATLLRSRCEQAP
jgi:hypothetical protein